MNYPYLIPGSQADPAAFVANSTLVLGTYDKPLDARTKIQVDYSALVPNVTLVGYSFKVRPGGEPQLWVSNSAIDKVDSTIFTFTISGGIAGRAYEVVLTTKLSSGDVRSDVLAVNVLGDNCGCLIVAPTLYHNGVVSGDGSVIVNTAPRYFISGTEPIGGRVLDRWFDTATGDIYDCASNGLSVYWIIAGSGGGGGGGGSSAVILNITKLHPDGATKAFTLTATNGRPVTVLGANTLFVSVDGVWQDATTQYTAAGNQITFSEAPVADADIFILWFAPPI